MAKSFSYAEKQLQKKFFIIFVFIFVLAILLYHLITHFAFKTYRIETDTMEPSFSTGNIVAISKLFNADSLNRGDVVYRKALHKTNLNVFQRLANSVVSLATAKFVLPFKDDEQALTKGGFYRVLGLPGDTIYLDNCIAYIKDASADSFLTEFEVISTKYDIETVSLPSDWEREMPFSGSSQRITLGENEFFLLTDNRKATLDSRLNGVCSIEDIEGKAVVVTWPFADWNVF